MSAKPIEQLKRTKHNFWFLFQLGYGIVALPLTLFNFASVVYYLVVGNFEFLKIIFPSFPIFLTVGVLVGPVTCILVGFLYAKSPYYRATYEVATSANPFSFRILPKEITLYKAIAKICEDSGYKEEAEELRKLIEQSS